MSHKKKPMMKASKMMKGHIKEEKKDLKADGKLLKEDKMMAKKMKGKC